MAVQDLGWRMRKKHAKKEVRHRNFDKSVGHIRNYVHPPAFARLDQSNQIYLLQRVSSLFSCSSMFMAVYLVVPC